MVTKTETRTNGIHKKQRRKNKRRKNLPSNIGPKEEISNEREKLCVSIIAHNYTGMYKWQEFGYSTGLRSNIVCQFQGGDGGLYAKSCEDDVP